ncbi:hypothetical protein PanWU01x14_273720 [Parasponia andersonii]|uniref:Uncharacterized protein n=1 Tax=Parasponia andersonii TaxID=3476 RepID=A0A2P5AA19_PARAD|nr:hypothetical protein PanWU01x14_353360 [Parasponia andersonii]PON43433.1 hypothetical protein PanWU01x14_273720 [Parasponia andersonii]
MKNNLLEFRKELDPPFVFAHNGLDLFGHFLENPPGFIFAWLFQGFGFPNLVKVSHIIHRSDKR